MEAATRAEIGRRHGHCARGQTGSGIGVLTRRKGRAGVGEEVEGYSRTPGILAALNSSLWHGRSMVNGQWSLLTDNKARKGERSAHKWGREWKSGSVIAGS